MLRAIDPADPDKREAHRLLTSVFIPRPIAWVGTVGLDGTPNLAPFSFANGVSSAPPVMMVAISDRRDGVPKDTLRNILATREFTISIVTESLMERMHRSSAPFPPEVSEFAALGLTPRPSLRVAAPGVEESPITLELTLREAIPVAGTGTTIVLGDVRLFRIDESLLADGLVDPERLRAVGRLGVDSYSVVDRCVRLPPVR
jgi:flavin reductase (DIM6/NTAB) family NADH-FMN oxidoreductase RutF